MHRPQTRTGIIPECNAVEGRLFSIPSCGGAGDKIKATACVYISSLPGPLGFGFLLRLKRLLLALYRLRTCRCPGGRGNDLFVLL
jgi:hypothetical protein